MATKMTLADLDFLDRKGENSQTVAVMDEPGKLSLRYAEIPEPGTGELRVKVKWVGVCGSDIEAFRGTREAEFVSFPARLGHEVAGVVDKLGPGVNGLNLGDQVTTRYVWGAFAEYIICRPFNVKVVPPRFPLRETSLVEILPGVLNAVELGDVDSTKSVLLMGQGVSGLVLTQVAALYSPKRLVVTDLKKKNLELAKQYGASDTYQIETVNSSCVDIVKKDFPEGFDIVIPCLLEGDGIVDAIDMAAQNGKIILYGCIGKTSRSIDLFKVHRKRLDIFSTEPKRDIDMRNLLERSVQLVLDGLVNTGDMVTHTFPLTEIQKAFDLRNDKGNDSIHVLVDCEVGDGS